VDNAVIDAKMTELRSEMDKAEAELAKLRPRVQYLEAMLHRLDGALTVLQGLKDSPAPIVAHANSQEPLALGA
jgi:hypothetical protein